MFDSELRILDSLARHAKNSPQRDALRISGETVSFSTLHKDVEQLAKYFAQFRHVFPPGSFLPLQVAQTRDSYVAVLSALAAGVPISLVDESTPEQRRRNLLRLFSARRFVEQDDIRERQDLGDVFDGELHASAEQLVAATGKTPILGLTSSGTTGEPKVIALDHEAVSIRLIPDLADAPGERQVSCTNTFSPLHFGGGFWRLGDIIHGITLQVMNLRRFLPSGIVDALRAGGVDGFRLPTEVLRLLGAITNVLEQFDRAAILKVGIGQAVLARDVLGVAPLFPAETLVRHSLSATESGEMFRWEGPIDDVTFSDRMPIGLFRPGGDVRIEARDGFVPGAGEVVVTGNKLALGYISDSVQPGRFATSVDGKREWFSGDIVQEGDNGVYTHISRLDDVVKVLGRFVSPSEIDVAVRRLPGVTDSITIPMGDGSSRLETFVECAQPHAMTQQLIRQHLEQLLPNHMMPGRLILLSTFPRTSRGKIDRQTLQATWS